MKTLTTLQQHSYHYHCITLFQIARSTTTLGQHKLGSGGMADTRDPAAYQDADPRKSISAAPSFEEYLKQRQAEGN